eukprot:scaffold126661_cov28-Tisochrysis_lutea.AAC.12
MAQHRRHLRQCTPLIHQAEEDGGIAACRRSPLEARPCGDVVDVAGAGLKHLMQEPLHCLYRLVTALLLRLEPCYDGTPLFLQDVEK